MPYVARIGDPFSCGDTVASGSANVHANGIPLGRITDATVGHGCWPPTIIAAGSGTVFANGLPVARVGDANVPHTCPPIPETHSGTISAGSTNVKADG